MLVIIATNSARGQHRYSLSDPSNQIRYFDRKSDLFAYALDWQEKGARISFCNHQYLHGEFRRYAQENQ